MNSTGEQISLPDDLPDELATAIKHHPDAAQRLINSDTDSAATETADPDMALSEEAQAGLEAIGELRQRGSLDTLSELTDILELSMAALDDEMVTSIAHTGEALGELADTTANDQTRQGLMMLLSAVGDATETDPERVGIVGLARASRDPEVQTGLGYLIGLAHALGQEIESADP